MIFKSEVQVGSDLEIPTDIALAVKNEPMLFNCRADYAYHMGGPITRNFLLTLIEDLARRGTVFEWKDIVFDSRSHMLMKDWYPCIPGFHHDDVPRIREDKQPYYYENEDQFRRYGHIDNAPTQVVMRSKHAFGLVGDPVCCTQFALGQAEFTPVGLGETLYKQWHPQVVAHLRSGQLDEWIAPMHKVVFFDDRSWHQGVAANGPGWRWFGRASWSTERVQNCTNEIRNQVQVYMENPMEGW